MKKIRLIPMLMIIMVLLSSCGGTGGDQSTQESETKVVTHLKGETEIPVNPKRLVDISGSAEELDILGIPYIACAQTSMYGGITIPPHLKDSFNERGIETVGNWCGMTDYNIERIVELKPDLIIMNMYSEKIYDQLKEIAPTVMLTDDYNYVKWRDRFLELGDWFNKREIAEQWLTDYDSKAEELSEEILEITGDETFAVLESNTVYLGSYYIYGVTAGPGEIIFNDLKLKRTDLTPTDTWADVVDLEYLAKVDADHILFTSDDGTLGELADSPVWQNLKAVQNGNVYLGDNETQYNLSYTSQGKLIYMEKLANAIKEHRNIE